MAEGLAPEEQVRTTGSGRNASGYLLVVLKGMCMGAADIVPGVSGGTVAFITGIYEELLSSIRSVTPAAFQLLLRQGPLAFWQHVNGNFLLALVLGIGLSVVSLAGLIGWLLETQPIPLWSFFFGLIVFSAIHVWRQIEIHRWQQLVMLLAGGVLAWMLTAQTPMHAEVTQLSLFAAGAVAICAMILPGISGSFILVLFGLYATVIAAIKGLDLSVLGIFAAGCLCGLLGFAHLLGWLLERFHAATLALLTGFMVGSLNRVWPWKQTLSWRVDRHGESVPVEQANVLPDTFAALTGQDSRLVLALVCFVAGLALVAIIEQVSKQLHTAGRT